MTMLNEGAYPVTPSGPISFTLLVHTDHSGQRHVVEVEATVTIADATWVGGGSSLEQATTSLLQAIGDHPAGNALQGSSDPAEPHAPGGDRKGSGD